MKKYTLPLILMVALLAACNHSTNFISKYLSPANLVDQSFIINTEKDTAVKTADGILVSIPANTIHASSSTVTLTIKEAVTLAEMLKSGLTTQAGKDILSSDGMFYIATKEESTVSGAIKISVPAFDADKKMQLYKGAEQDGKIDWQSPAPITKTVDPLSDSGEILFKAYCAPCHGVARPLTGPALAWMDKRKSRHWLHAYIQDNFQVKTSDGNEGSYACCLSHKWGSAMPAYKLLSNDNIDAICRYVDKVSKEEGIHENFNPNSDCDSCTYYHAYYAELMGKRDSLVIGNGEMAKVEITPPPAMQPSQQPLPVNANFISNNVMPTSNAAEYYQFDITAYGWYNIDVLLHLCTGTQNSELRVRIQGEFKYRAKVMLVIPSRKVVAQGGYLENSNDYGFYTTDGKIPLPQGDDAFIIAVSEQNEKLFYAQQHFITSAAQTIDMALHENTKEGILQSFSYFQLSGVDMTIEKAKNFDGVKGIDSELKKVESKLVNCTCQYTAPSVNAGVFGEK